MEYFYFLSSPLLFISGIPQTIKLLKTKKSKDISSLTYFLTWLAVFIIFLKAIDSKEFNLILPNFISFIMLSINLFLILKYKKNDEDS